MSTTEPFPTFSPSDIRKLLNKIILSHFTIGTAADGRTLTHNSDPRNGLLLITAHFIAIKLANIISRYMGKPKDIREVVTGSFSAAKECDTVFGNKQITRMGYPTLKSDASVCWLCGFTINEMGQAIKHVFPTASIWSEPGKPLNPHAANAPECEHIVPAGAAMVYLDIPSRKRRDAEGNNDDLYVNYEWSHKFCNATASDGGEGEGSAGKSDKLFFNMLDEAGNLLSPTVNNVNISRWLQRLAGIPIMYTLINAKYKDMPPDPINAWANAQAAKMVDRVNKVCDYIVLKRSKYPTIFGQGVPGSELGGDAFTPPTPSLGDTQKSVGSGVMVGDLLNIARNVSFVYNDLIIRNTSRSILEAVIFSQSMLHLQDERMLGIINQNREILTTQKGFYNDNGNGILNGVMPLPLKQKLSEKPIQMSDIAEHYTINFRIWMSNLNADQANDVQQAQRNSLSLGGGLLPSVFRGKRKKTRRNKLKQKRTRRNKKSKK